MSLAHEGVIPEGGIRGILGSSQFMKWIMTRKAFGLVGLAAMLLAAPAFSHHSFAVFDQSKVLHMAGTVKEFELVNPHAWLHLNIVNEKGDVLVRSMTVSL